MPVRQMMLGTLHITYKQIDANAKSYVVSEIVSEISNNINENSTKQTNNATLDDVSSRRHYRWELDLDKSYWCNILKHFFLKKYKTF